MAQVGVLLVKVYALHNDTVEAWWPHVVERLGVFFNRYPDYNALQIEKQIKENNYFVWVAEDGKRLLASVVVSIQDRPNTRIAMIMFAGGEQAPKWCDRIVTQVGKWATEKGCTDIEINGRRGWLKLLNGFKEKSVIIRKSLVNG